MSFVEVGRRSFRSFCFLRFSNEFQQTSIEELKQNLNDEENQLKVIKEHLKEVEDGLTKTIEEKEILLVQHSIELDKRFLKKKSNDFTTIFFVLFF